MKRTKEVTKKLFIEELERPAYGITATTLAIGEESSWGDGKLTTLAIGEEAK